MLLFDTVNWFFISFFCFLIKNEPIYNINNQFIVLRPVFY